MLIGIDNLCYDDQLQAGKMMPVSGLTEVECVMSDETLIPLFHAITCTCTCTCTCVVVNIQGAGKLPPESQI